MSGRTLPLLALLAVACGPAVSLDPGTDTDETDASSSGTTPAPGTSTTTSTPPGTTSVPPSTSSTSTPPDGTSTFDPSTTSGTSIGESGDISSGSNFIDPTGGGIFDPCHTWTQDCPEGLKCNPFALDGNVWNSALCVPIDPQPDQPGEPCTVEDSPVSGYDSCDIGSMCFFADPETLEGTCVAFCTGSEAVPGCADPSAQCVMTGDGVLNLCIETCDPLGQDCPLDGFSCHPLDDFFGCVPDTVPAGEGSYGESCEFISQCDAGLVCIGAQYVPDCSGTGCCSPYCDTSLPNTCPGQGQVCVPWFEDNTPPPGLDTLGVCALEP